MNADAFLFTFASAIRQSVNTPTLMMGVYVLYEAVGVVQQFRADEPKSERFWFACGIVLHWIATVMGRWIDIMRENEMILVRTAFALTTLNLLLFVAPAGLSYVRALTQHRLPNRWKTVALLYLIVMAVTFAMGYF